MLIMSFVETLLNGAGCNAGIDDSTIVRLNEMKCSLVEGAMNFMVQYDTIR